MCLLLSITPAGMIVASDPNPAVSASILNEIIPWKIEGCSDDDVIVCLRQRTVPEGYKFHPWIRGE